MTIVPHMYVNGCSPATQRYPIHFSTMVAHPSAVAFVFLGFAIFVATWPVKIQARKTWSNHRCTYLWSQAFLSNSTHTAHFNPDEYDPHWWGSAWYEEGVCGWQSRGGGAPTPSAPMQRVMPTWGGVALTWVVLTWEEGGWNRPSCHAFQAAPGCLYQHLGSASSNGMSILGQNPQDQSKT